MDEFKGRRLNQAELHMTSEYYFSIPVKSSDSDFCEIKACLELRRTFFLFFSFFFVGEEGGYISPIFQNQNTANNYFYALNKLSFQIQ